MMVLLPLLPPIRLHNEEIVTFIFHLYTQLWQTDFQGFNSFFLPAAELRFASALFSAVACYLFTMKSSH